MELLLFCIYAVSAFLRLYNMKNKTILLLSACGALMLAYSCKSQFDTTREQFNVKASNASLERGKNLTYNVCAQCHYNRGTKSFIGTEMDDLPKFFGKIYSSNITNHPNQVMGRYSDAELFYLIKTGIARDGRFIPYMVRPTIADQDLKDIIAYLRSDDDPVRGRDTMVGITHVSFLGKLATKIAGKPLKYQTGIKAPDPGDQIAQGRYLVDQVGCFHCHSKSIMGLNYRNAEDSKGYMAGGMKFNVHGEKIFGSNLTPDKETGIGNYGTVSFRNAVRAGEGLNGKELKYPMRRFKHMTDQQCDAIFAYLKTLKPVRNKVRGH